MAVSERNSEILRQEYRELWEIVYDALREQRGGAAHLAATDDAQNRLQQITAKSSSWSDRLK